MPFKTRVRHERNWLRLATIILVLSERASASYTSLSKLVFEATPTKGPWQSYSFSPESRVITPVSVYFANGSISHPQTLVAPEPYRSMLPSTALHGQTAALTLDFGQNVAGIPTITFGKDSQPGEVFGMAFAESKQFISRTSDRCVICQV